LEDKTGVFGYFLHSKLSLHTGGVSNIHVWFQLGRKNDEIYHFALTIMAFWKFWIYFLAFAFIF